MMSEEAADQALRDAVQRIAAGENLESDQMAEALGVVMDGHGKPEHLGALLMGLRLKGETADEILGAARAMRSRATRISLERPVLLDTCGTGGDGAGTFNISTAVALVCAAAGLPVAKHGNRAISSRVGSADVLESLGLRLDLTPEAIQRCIEEVGIGFLFAPAHHSAMRHAGPVRRALGFRSILNQLGPLTNPAGATHQLIGIYDGSRVPIIAEVLGRLGARRALVVHGHDGLDELTITGPSRAALWNGREVEEFEVDPRTLGLELHPIEAIAGGGPEHNASIIRSVLGGSSGPSRQIVQLNAGAALWVGEAADSLAAGVELAGSVLASGQALTTLERLANLTQELAP